MDEGVSSPSGHTVPSGKKKAQDCSVCVVKDKELNCDQLIRNYRYENPHEVLMPFRSDACRGCGKSLHLCPGLLFCTGT